MRMGSPSLKTTYEFQATRREPSHASASNFLLAIRRLGIAFRDAAGVLGTLGQRHIPSSPFDVGLPLIRTHNEGDKCWNLNFSVGRLAHAGPGLSCDGVKRA